MTETFKKFSDELKKEISEKINSKEFKELAEKIKSAGDSGAFEVVVSTQDQDRQGEIVDQAGWDLSFYKLNPVVLWAHDYYSLPIGLTDEIEVKEGKLVAKGKFAPADANPFAQQVRKLYDAGIVKTTSVGFIPKETDGQNIKRAELLEFSFVPVPANPFALSLRQIKEMSLDLEMLKMKGIEIKEEGKKEEEKKSDKKEKGDVADEITTQENRKKKWANLDKIDKIIYGFYGVYLEPETQPEEFEKLLAEVIELLKKLLPEDMQKSNDCKKITEKIKDGNKKSLLDLLLEKSVEKSGRVLSKKNRDLIATSIAQLKDSIAALEELLTATEPQEGEGKTLPKQRSNGAGVEEVSKSLDAYLETRQVLRLVTNSLTNSLERMNKKIRENSKR